MATGTLGNMIGNRGSFKPETWIGSLPGWDVEGTNFQRIDFGVDNAKRGCQYGCMIKNSTSATGIIKTEFVAVQNHKYYYCLWAASDALCDLFVGVWDNVTGYQVHGVHVNAPDSGQIWSNIFTAPSNNNSRISFFPFRPDRTTADCSVTVTAIMLIDLTRTYGAGNEPSWTVMDAIVSELGGFWTGEKSIDAVTVTKPGSVGKLNLVGNTDTTLSFSWSNPNTSIAPVDGYHVYTQTGGGGWRAATLSTGGYQINGNTNTSCTIVGVDAVNLAYQIKVVAFRGAVEGDFTAFDWTATGVSTDEKAPSVVTNFSGTSGKGDGAITFSWTAPVYAANIAWDGFQIFCMDGAISNWTGLVYSGTGTLSGKKFVQIDDKNARSYKWTGLTIGVTYKFIIYAFNVKGAGPTSTELTITIAPLMPSYPMSFSVTSGAVSTTAVLSWAAPKTVGVPAYTTYQIWRQVKNPSGVIVENYTTSPYTTVSGTTYSNTGLNPKYTYSYKVAAVNTYGPGAKTNEVSISIVGLPSAPRNFTVHLENGTYPVLDWASPLDDGGEVQTSYTIYCDTSNGSIRRSILNGTVQDAIQIDAKPGTHYYYKIAAINSAGEGVTTSTEIVVPADAKDTKLISIGNVLTNGNFDLDIGTTNWTVNPTSAANCVDSPSGFWVGKVLRLSGGDAYTDVDIPAGHTILVTCKLARVSGTAGYYGWIGICPKDTYIITSDSSTLYASSDTPSRKWTSSNVMTSHKGIRILVRAPSDGNVIMDIDGIMLIDLSNVYGHSCVFTTESNKFTEFIGLVDGFLGGYWEGCFTLTKIID